MSTVPPYIALVVPFMTMIVVHHPGKALTLRHFVSSKYEAFPVAYMTCLSSSTLKPSPLAYWVVLKGSKAAKHCVMWHIQFHYVMAARGCGPVHLQILW